MAEFRSEAEIVERTLKTTKNPVKPPPRKRKGNPKSDSPPPTKKKTFYCSHHGQNTSHSSSECKVLLAKKGEIAPKKNNKKNGGKNIYSNVRKEVNLLATNAEKLQALNEYQRVLNQERAKLQRKHEVAVMSEDTEEDDEEMNETSDEEIQVIDVDVATVKPNPVELTVVPRKPATPTARISTLSTDSATKKSRTPVAKQPPKKPSREPIGNLSAPKPKSKAKVQKELEELHKAALKQAANTAVPINRKPNTIVPTHLSKKAQTILDTTPEEKAFLKQVKATAS